MRISAAIVAFAALVAGSAAASCPYAERGNVAAAAASCPYAKRAATPVIQDAPVLSRRTPIEGKKGIFYSEYHSIVRGVLVQEERHILTA